MMIFMKAVKPNDESLKCQHEEAHSDCKTPPCGRAK